MFISNRQLSQQIDYDTVDILAQQQILQSPEFTEANKERVNLMKQHAINKRISQFNQELLKKQQENFKIKLQIESLPKDEDLTPLYEQYKEKMKPLVARNASLRAKLNELKGNIEVLSFRQEEINKLAKE